MTRVYLDLKEYGKIPVDSFHRLDYETEAGPIIEIFQTKSVPSLGGWVYESAYCLCKLLESKVFEEEIRKIYHDPHFCFYGNKSLIELGAGVGIVGLVFSFMANLYSSSIRSKCLITDMEPLVPLIQFNIQYNRHLFEPNNEMKQNNKIVIRADPLSWGNEQMIDNALKFLNEEKNTCCPHNSSEKILNNDNIKKITDLSECKNKFFDYVILANCVYYSSSLKVLLQTMCELSSPNSLVIASYEMKTVEIEKLIERWHQLVEEKFIIYEIKKDVIESLNIGKTYFKDFVKIFCFKKKGAFKYV